jgi:5-oxoprolinase (ATP-hydrolysing) subunit A
MRVDLNCDMGESFGAYVLGADAEIMPFITSANIAAGFHAGDPQVMDRTVALAAKSGVGVGAHPGFPDLVGFGRRVMSCTPDEVEAMVLYQVAVVAGFAQAHAVALRHVKPHGALYNMAAQDPSLALAIARGVARFDRGLTLVGLSGSHAMQQAAQATGLRFAAEAFADRAYNPDGTLVSRQLPGSVLTDPAQAAAQVVRMVKEQIVLAHDGTRVVVAAETICLHGDNPSAAANAKAIRAALEGSGIEVVGL